MDKMSHLASFSNTEPEDVFKYETADEAYDLLQNGILIETSKGLVCMSLTDALSSDLNLSEEDLKNVATKLILQQNVTPKIKEKVYLKTSNLNFDSDGFSSECSDISVTSASSAQSTIVTVLPNDIKLVAPLKLENIEKESKIAVSCPNLSQIQKPEAQTSNISIKPVETSVDNSNETKVTNNQSSEPNCTVIIDPLLVEVHKPPKRRGGWPKGRKRKPELLNLPPKAPATGYNLYLNEQRKSFKDSSLVFHEITKIIGNKWSNLSLEEKRPYLAKAEEDKRRYREELKQYRQSDAYRAYLSKKRKNRLQNNVLSESDMDATDEIDDEDNEELYCRTCDQWFHNLHNKREHLQGKQHTQSLAGEMKRELGVDRITSRNFNTSLDESSLDAMPNTSGSSATSLKTPPESNSIIDCMISLTSAVSKREKEIDLLQQRLQATTMTQNALCQELSKLRQKQNHLRNNLNELKITEREMEAKVSNLWQVPSWFVITDLNIEPSVTQFNDFSE